MENTQASGAHLTEESFDHAVAEHRGPVLVDFYADWCPPCHAIAPTLEDRKSSRFPTLGTGHEVSGASVSSLGTREGG